MHMMSLGQRSKNWLRYSTQKWDILTCKQITAYQHLTALMVCPDPLNSFSLLLFITIKCYIFLSFFCAWIWAPASSQHRYSHIHTQLPQPQSPPCCTISAYPSVHQSPCILSTSKANAELPRTSQHHRACPQPLCWALTLHLFCCSSSGLKVLLPDNKTKGNRQKIFNGTSWVTSATQIPLCGLQIPVRDNLVFSSLCWEGGWVLQQGELGS